MKIGKNIMFLPIFFFQKHNNHIWSLCDTLADLKTLFYNITELAFESKIKRKRATGMKFPKDFIWGAATASYQIEGAAFEDGKGRNIWDDFCCLPGKIADGSSGETATDHYHRYKEDVALMKELGIKVYRFSLSWARILPEGIGRVNQKGLDFYNSLIDELIKNGIEPYITLYHWDYPSVLMVNGGWGNEGSPKWFEEYTRVVAKAFGDRVKNFITFNEPQAFMGAGFCGTAHAPGISYPPEILAKMCHNVLKAHGMAVKALREIVPDCRVGWAPCAISCIPASDSEEDIEAAREKYFGYYDEFRSFVSSPAWWSDPVVLGHYPEDGLKLFEKYLPEDYEKDMELICQPLDFYGQNIYQGIYVKKGENGPEKVQLPFGFPRTAMGWNITPESLYWGTKFLYERYNLPIIITENGISCRDNVCLDGKVHDTARIDFYNRYLLSLSKAITDGVDIIGYIAWSLMDNFEWQQGYIERFGLIYVNYQTLERIPKDSFYWYKQVIESNGETL